MKGVGARMVQVAWRVLMHLAMPSARLFLGWCDRS